MSNQLNSPAAARESPQIKENRRPLRVAYLSPSALLDPASGASQSVQTMLQALAAKGVECHVLTASCFDAPFGDQLPTFLGAQGLKPGKIKKSGPLLWRGIISGLRLHMMHVQSQRRLAMTSLEEMNFLDLARDWLKQVKPDVVITFGGLLLDVELMRQAQTQGAAVAFYLANGNYHKPQTFETVDLVLTNSDSTAALYKKRMNLAAYNVGLFVDGEAAKVAAAERKYVTFINPQAEKGVTLFLKLLERAQQDCPDMQFMVVESRSQLLPAIKKLGLPETLLDNVVRVPRQKNLKGVYAQTRILLMPSFWFEAAGRVLIEATANGIPVIAANRGGIPETLAGGGVVLDIPEACIKDHWQVPDPQAVQAWWEQLKQHWMDPVIYEKACVTALNAAQSHALDAKATRLLKLLHAALARRDQRQQRRRQVLLALQQQTTPA